MERDVCWEAIPGGVAGQSSFSFISEAQLNGIPFIVVISFSPFRQAFPKKICVQKTKFEVSTQSV